MVTQQILVLFFQVRVLVVQRKRLSSFRGKPFALYGTSDVGQSLSGAVFGVCWGWICSFYAAFVYSLIFMISTGDALN